MNCPLNIWKTDKSVLTVFLIFFFFLGSMDSTFFPPGLLKHSNISEHNSYQVIGRCSWRHFIVGLFIVKNNYEHKDTMFGDLPWIWNQYFVSDSSFCEFCRLWPIYLLLDFKPIWDTVLGDLFHQCLYDWKQKTLLRPGHFEIIFLGNSSHFNAHSLVHPNCS